MEDMSFRMTCVKGGPASLVLQECMSSGWHILLYGVSYWETYSGSHVFQEDKSCFKVCLIGGHVLQDGRSYWMICLTGRHVLQEDRSFWMVCLIGGHVLH